MADYIDSMETKMEDVLSELKSMREQLSGIQGLRDIVSQSESFEKILLFIGCDCSFLPSVVITR